MKDYEELSYIGKRKLWKIHSFKIIDEPIMKSMRYANPNEEKTENYENPNGVTSKTVDGLHMPILDLDFPHTYVPSTKEGHGHLYLNVPISNFRWFILMIALYYAKVIELGFFIWSIRRGMNQVRLPYIKKNPEDEGTYTHGWFFKLRANKTSK